MESSHMGRRLLLCQLSPSIKNKGTSCPFKGQGLWMTLSISIWNYAHGDPAPCIPPEKHTADTQQLRYSKSFESYDFSFERHPLETRNMRWNPEKHRVSSSKGQFALILFQVQQFSQRFKRQQRRAHQNSFGSLAVRHSKLANRHLCFQPEAIEEKEVTNQTNFGGSSIPGSGRSGCSVRIQHGAADWTNVQRSDVLNDLEEQSQVFDWSSLQTSNFLKSVEELHLRDFDRIVLRTPSFQCCAEGMRSPGSDWSHGQRSSFAISWGRKLHPSSDWTWFRRLGFQDLREMLQPLASCWSQRSNTMSWDHREVSPCASSGWNECPNPRIEGNSEDNISPSSGQTWFQRISYVVGLEIPKYQGSDWSPAQSSNS